MIDSVVQILNAISPIPLEWSGLLFRGLLSTIFIALGAYALGLTIGFFGALGKLYGPSPLRWFLEGYTTIIRAVPELVLILLIFYAGTDLINLALAQFGLRPIDINPILAGIVVIGVVMGAYSTEVIRGAIMSVPKGQVEAGRAYGMTAALSMRRIVIPAMLPLAIPGLANLWLIVTKDTALLAVIGSIELATVTKQSAGSTRLYFNFYFVAGLIYLALTLVSMYFLRHLENHFRRGFQSQGQGS